MFLGLSSRTYRSRLRATLVKFSRLARIGFEPAILDHRKTRFGKVDAHEVHTTTSLLVQLSGEMGRQASSDRQVLCVDCGFKSAKVMRGTNEKRPPPGSSGIAGSRPSGCAASLGIFQHTSISYDTLALGWLGDKRVLWTFAVCVCESTSCNVHRWLGRIRSSAHRDGRSYPAHQYATGHQDLRREPAVERVQGPA
jgi:hypothetical protein